MYDKLNLPNGLYDLVKSRLNEDDNKRAIFAANITLYYRSLAAFYKIIPKEEDVADLGSYYTGHMKDLLKYLNLIIKEA